jgi:hypothetical protein
MSEETRKDETQDEVEGHMARPGITDEPTGDTDNEVEGHMHGVSARTDARTDARPD